MTEILFMICGLPFDLTPNTLSKIFMISNVDTPKNFEILKYKNNPNHSPNTEHKN
jgi:hypothetical protein